MSDDTPAAPDVAGLVAQELHEWATKLTTYPHQPPLDCPCQQCKDADTLFEAAHQLTRLAAEIAHLQANGPQVQRGTTGMDGAPWMGTMREAWQDEMAAARAEGRRADELYAREGELAREVEMLREALSKLVGILEIAAVMPDAIGRHLVMRWDAPEIEQARAALAALAARGEG